MQDPVDVARLHAHVIKVLPVVVAVHRVRHVVPSVRVLANVLHHGEQTVLCSFLLDHDLLAAVRRFCLPVFWAPLLLFLAFDILRGEWLSLRVEDAHSKRRTHDRVTDLKDLVEAHEVLHLDQTISPDKPLQLETQHIWQLGYELLVPGRDSPPILLVVADILVFEVGLETCLQVGREIGDFKIDHEEWLLGCRHVLRALNVKFSLKNSSEDVADQTGFEDLLLVLLDSCCFVATDLTPVAIALQLDFVTRFI